MRPRSAAGRIGAVTGGFATVAALLTVLVGCGDSGERTALSCPDLAIGATGSVPLDRVSIQGLPTSFDDGVHARVTGEPVPDAEAHPAVAYTFVSRTPGGGWILHAPLHPSGRLEGGSVRLEIRDSRATCPPVAFQVEPLPPAPGELDRVRHALERYIEAQAHALGTTGRSLREARHDTLSAPVLSLWIAQHLVDHPDNPTSLAAVTRKRAGTEPSRRDAGARADALLARIGAASHLDDLVRDVESVGSAPPGALETLRGIFESPSVAHRGDGDGTPAGLLGWLSPASLHAASKGQESPETFRMSAEGLDWAMSLALSSDLATGGRAGALLKAFSFAVGLEAALTTSVAPATSQNAARLGLAAFAFQSAAEATAKLLPRRFVAMSYDLDPTEYLEDESRTGHWENVQVKATSGEWRIDKFTLSALAQLAGMKQAGGLSAVFDEAVVGSKHLVETANALVEFASSSLLQEIIDTATKGSGLAVGPHHFLADLSDPEWHQAKIVGRAVQHFPGVRSYRARDVGTAEITVSTPPKRFGHQLIRSSRSITVLRTAVELTRTTASFEPGDAVEFRAEVEHVEDTDLRFTKSAGQLLAYSERGEGSGIWDFTIATPPDPEEYPVEVRAYSTANRDHLLSGGNPRFDRQLLRALKLVVRPAGECVAPGEEQRYEAVYPDADLGDGDFEGGTVADPGTLEWSASSGTIEDGVFTAPRRAGEVTIRVEDPEDPQVRGQAVAIVRDCAWTMTIGSGDRAGFYWGREASLRPPRDPGSSGSGAVLLTDEETYLGLTAPVRVTIGLDGVPPGETGPFRSGGISNQATVIFNDSARSGSGRAAMGGLLEAAGPLASNPYSAYWTETPVGRGASVETADGPLPLDRIHTLRGSFDIPDPANLVITANEAGRVAGRVSGEFLTLVAGSLSGPWAGDSAAFDAVQIEIAFDAEAGEHERRLESARDAVMGDGGGGGR